MQLTLIKCLVSGFLVFLGGSLSRAGTEEHISAKHVRICIF